VVDTSAIKPPKGEEMFHSLPDTHGLFGTVLKTFGTRGEADKEKGPNRRVHGNLQPGHWVSQSDIVPELVRGLPNRG
jgi:hypothetical protein